MSSATPKCITTTNDSSSTPTSLPPHTERLLQLLADGQEAVVERLAAASTSSPSTRRLLQHRLVQLLQHSQWKTRTCAARALACVVTSSSKDYQQQTTALSHTTNTLSLDWVRQHLGTILEQGQRLYAYDEDDSNQSKKNDATLPSLQQQGEILAARLGLQQLPCQQDFWQQLTSDDVDDDSTTMQPTAKRLKREDLIMMTTEKDDNTSASSSSLVDLLLFSMLDGRWQVRHGACLGILALLQQQRHATLTCSDTILAHALVVLALDRFGDFSGATCCTNNNNLMTASSVVAPVQQVAAQIVALLYRDNVMELLQELVKHKDWQVRHGALCAFEFLVARRQSEDNDMPKGVIFQLAVQALQYDESDDNKSAAALILKQCLRRDWSAACAPLVAVLETAATYSSCLVNVVSLLQLWLEMDCEKVLRNIKKNENDNNVLGRMVQRLVELLDAEFASVKLSVLLCLGSLATSRVPVDVFAKVVLRLFDFYLDDSSPAILQEDTSLSGQIVVARDKVWRLFAQSAESVIAHDMQAREALLYEMVVRYFGVGRQRAELQPTRDDFSLRLGAATALAEFLTRSKQESAVVLQIAIVSFLQSPWACQCEAACLLLRRVSLDSSSTTFEWKERYSIVYDLVSQTVPPCLVVCANNKGCETLKRYDVAKRCGEAFITCIGKSQGGDVLVVVQSIVSQWSDEFQSHGVDYKHSTVKVPANVLSMRVYCSLAGSLVALGLPAKITPTVRALMTSLKNETGSAPSLESRLGQTCCYLCDMLGTISQLDQYEAAYKKILCTVCDLAVNGLNEGIRDTPGALTLELLVSKLGSNLSLRDLDPLWMRLEAVRSTIDVDKEDMVASVRLLQIVSKGIASNNRADLLLVRDFVLPLTKFACETCEDDCFELCLSTLGSLCTLESRRLLKDALVALLPYVRSIDNLQRSKACMILETLVLDANVEVRPFVKSLLPVAMSLMTDPSEECSRKANRVFSVLVRVAPLVGQDSVALDDSFVDDNQSVIDHLIFGKPLPLCHLPPLIQGSLSKAGVLLRPYQAEGIAWLRFLQQVNLNGALCDSMGLGKTLQALVGIALSHEDKDTKEAKSLIVCPSTLLGHWASEVEKFFPGEKVFKVLCMSGTRSNRHALWKDSSRAANLVVTSYSNLRSDVDLLSTQVWRCCVLDEGHLLKNPKSATAKASRRLKSTHKLILTGTPVQNRVHELWAIFDFLMPNFLGSAASFTKEFAGPITKGQAPVASAVQITESMDKLKLLHQQVLPFILRREKEQVLNELPPKIVSVIKVPMSDIQAKIYAVFCRNSSVKASLAKIHQIVDSFQGPNANESSLGSDVLKSLLFLRLLCTHPSLATKEGTHKEEDWFSLRSSGKLLALAEFLRAAGVDDGALIGADNDTSLLYNEDSSEDEVQGTYSTIVESTTDRGLQFETKGESPHGRKCIIFAQFTKSLDVLEEILLKAHMPSVGYLRLDGKVPPEDRARLAHQFNTDDDIRILISTTRVGGLGLNLTGADTVVFLENDFNPYWDIQAADRAHRIGQNKVVSVYSFVTKDSIEERITDLQERKVAVSESIVNTENSSMYSMGTDRLLDIFSSRDDGDESKAQAVDLDALVEKVGEDYASLSVDQFLDRFEKHE